MKICTDYKSVNYDQRAPGCVPELIIIHCTELDFTESMSALTLHSDRPVSSHYLIDTDGKIFQLVDINDRAWHAGVCYWQGRNSLNAHSIGIELVNPGHLKPDNAYGQKQMNAALELCATLQSDWNIHKSNVLAHSDIAPQRKTDPGSHFNWEYLAENGVGIYPKDRDGCGNLKELQQKLHTFGYQIDITGILDQQTLWVIEAFKMHFTKGVEHTYNQYCGMLNSLITQQSSAQTIKLRARA